MDSEVLSTVQQGKQSVQFRKGCHNGARNAEHDSHSCEGVSGNGCPGMDNIHNAVPPNIPLCTRLARREIWILEDRGSVRNRRNKPVLQRNERQYKRNKSDFKWKYT